MLTPNPDYSRSRVLFMNRGTRSLACLAENAGCKRLFQRIQRSFCKREAAL
jgi:hypothetical protein